MIKKPARAEQLNLPDRVRRFKDQRNPSHRLDLIRQTLGSRAGMSVRPWEIEDWLTGVQRRSTRGDRRLTKKAPLKPGTLNRLKAHLSAIYQHGKLRDKVQVNPARDVKQRLMKNGVIRWLKPEEAERLASLLSHIETKAHLAQDQEPLVRHRLCKLDVALGTLMQKGEQYGLKWIDVDFDQRVITLRNTKNGESRLVYMIDDFVAAFERLRELNLGRRAGRNDPAPVGPVFTIGDNKKWWAQALRDARIENFRWHDLMHTFCSRLAQKGMGLKVIQEAAGHKTIPMSARYAHMVQTSLRSALTVLNRSVALRSLNHM